MNSFVKYFDSNSKYIHLLVHDKEILNKYNAVWDIINNLFKKGFDSKPMYNDKYIKAKTSLSNVNLYGNKIPRENERYTFLSGILLDPVVDVEKKSHRLIFLEKCKYAVKNKKIISTINEELNINRSDDQSDNDKSNKYDED